MQTLSTKYIRYPSCIVADETCGARDR